MRKIFLSLFVLCSAATYSWADLSVIRPYPIIEETDGSPSSATPRLVFPPGSVTMYQSSAVIAFAGADLQAGSSNYIQNGTLLQQASFYVLTGSATTLFENGSRVLTVSPSTDTKNGGLNVFGYVGIGTGTPTAQLHIFNPAGMAGTIERVSTGTTNLWEVSGASAALSVATFTVNATVFINSRILFNTSSVTISGCGTGALVTDGSTPYAGSMTVGTAPGTCVVTFGISYPTRTIYASCLDVTNLGVTPVHATSISKSAFTCSGTIALNDILEWHTDGN